MIVMTLVFASILVVCFSRLSPIQMVLMRELLVEVRWLIRSMGLLLVLSGWL